MIWSSLCHFHEKLYAFWFLKLYSNFSECLCSMGTSVISSCSSEILDYICFWLLNIGNEFYYLVNAVWQVKCLKPMDSGEVVVVRIPSGSWQKMGNHSWSRMKSNGGKPVDFKNFFLVAAAGGADGPNTQPFTVVTLGNWLQHTGLWLLMCKMWGLEKGTLSSASALGWECICILPCWELDFHTHIPSAAQPDFTARICPHGQDWNQRPRWIKHEPGTFQLGVWQVVVA